ncbi:C40 family peptidase [Glaciibacter sp. 2TAF33]|uniref:C40 family peptidase n=1 Tax=Glaciibacter sp. 2TAF33 TaxID=3233015 RepID=UPI003F903B4C
MTMIEAMGRIGEIQSSLLQLSGAKSATAATDTSAAFAASLASFGGTSGASGTGVPPATIANPGAATGTDVVASAQKYLGVPYVFGGEDASGMDCSGLVQRVYADLGIDVPRLVSGQMKIGTEVGSLAQAKPGDLIVTGGGEHILIYAGNNRVIHAPYEGRTVSLVDAYMTDADIDTIRRVIPQPSAAASASPGGGSTDLISAALASFATGGAR